MLPKVIVLPVAFIPLTQLLIRIAAQQRVAPHLKHAARKNEYGQHFYFFYGHLLLYHQDYLIIESTFRYSFFM